MPLAPVEYALITFDATALAEGIVPAMTDLVDKGLVHIIDLAFIRKEADGGVVAFELADLPVEEAAAFAGLDQDIRDLVNNEDIQAQAEQLTPGTSAIMIVWENLWAQQFAEAVRAAGGVLTDSQRIPPVIVEAALAAAAE